MSDSYDSLQLLYKVNTIAYLAINVVAFFALFAGSRRRGGSATALGLFGVFLTVPSAAYAAALLFDWYKPNYSSDTAAWVSAGLNSASIVGLAFVLLALIIAKSSTPRTQYQSPAPPQPYQGYGSQPNPWR